MTGDKPAVVADHRGADGNDGVSLRLQNDVGQPVEPDSHGQLFLEVPGGDGSVEDNLVNLHSLLVV